MGQASSHRYVIALGSNMRVPGIGAPRAVLRGALDQLADSGAEVEAVSRIRASRPVGPSLRSYSNGAAIVSAPLDPPAMLALLQSVESEFGRDRRGARWRARSLDLDIVLWSGGAWFARDLVIPHLLFRERDFVLRPAAEIAPDWRDPVTGLTLRQLAAHAACAR
ncbi:2-amino-4-hydroxy-6-hydroxymethyldihydropteridine diphosphokinase [Qipengyuania gaetbuli]|uniref:2-amino-4-hydroxy-6- hydroxymethyldihydropteridine diphosphokinase n=1 Tax=Qipengyuania gaetbuli TaxID=266952 RepID=UPI001CD27125|nr:2-amino-4-hydroxy-6-hydroxymethyldihydropteridine diphosphokinase [Qipengyuania gaetbuli]MCA0910546.1 2-amino-4-hydroxy-6-hydroxymethyldihydropteridine diphosphokinase [Qipengyuania gaetbuli]